MEYALVFGAQQFIGFELCKALVNQGYEVLAIDEQQQEEMLENNKWMEIGRNANLQYREIGESIELQDNMICFLPIYDYYIVEKKDILQKVYSKLEDMMDAIHKVVVISPTQCFKSEWEEKWCSDILKKDVIFHQIYVPTLYGPWQPQSLLFHQLISGDLQLDYKDDPSDAIFIEDAVNTIISLLEDRQDQQQTIMLQNEAENRWEELAHEIDHSFHIENRERKQRVILEDGKIKIISVKESIPFHEALRLQMKQMKSCL